MSAVVGVAIVIILIAIFCYMTSSKKTEEEQLYQDCKNELVGIDGFFEGQIIPIRGEIVIGRDSDKCSLVYPPDTKGVSSVHCKITYSKLGIGIMDMHSSCGTYRMSGECIKPGEIQYLHVGDGFYIGEKKNIFLIR
ncbi:MAG: FHA domain-containing protein [Acetatifactor sp.]